MENPGYSTRKRRALQVVGLLLLALCASSAASARTETLRWKNAASDPGIEGYRVHTGPSSGFYNTVVDVGLPPINAQGEFYYDLELSDDETAYVVITAYNGALSSGYSNQQILEPVIVPEVLEGATYAGIHFLQADEANFPEGSDAEFLSGGAAAGDYDGDGWVDLYVTRLDAPDSLYRNQGDGSFADVTLEAGLEFDLASNGAAWGDVDNDGGSLALSGYFLIDRGGIVRWRFVEAIDSLSDYGLYPNADEVLQAAQDLAA